jgi:signal peptide peptidase SppA
MEGQLMLYSRIVQAIQSQPWAILPNVLNDIMDVMTYQASGNKLDPDEVQALVGIKSAHVGADAEGGGGIQILRLRGVVAHRVSAIEGMSTGAQNTSTEMFTASMKEAIENPQVGTIVIDIDSPGGAVTGIPELSDLIRSNSARHGGKRIVAIANSLAASAAFWIGSSADEFVAIPSGDVGSVGAFAAHSDISEKLAAEGERITLIHAGKFKVEGNPFEPLSDDARAFMQSRVDDAFDQFVSDVAQNRGVSIADVKSGFGQGRTLSASDALAAGMIDGIETMEALLVRLQGDAPARQNSRASRFAGTPGAFQYSKASDFDAITSVVGN